MASMKQIIINFILLPLSIIMNSILHLPEGNTFCGIAYTENLRFVAAKAGLRMRETPGRDGKVIVNIPFNSQVQVVEEKDDEEEISGTRGKWVRITWSGKSGWIFSGFLSDKSAAGNVDFSIESLIGKKTDL